MAEILGILARLFARFGPLIATSLIVLVPIGWAYWLYTAIQFGSFTMFFIGILIPLLLIVAPIGLWSLVFGVPEWLMSIFG